MAKRTFASRTFKSGTFKSGTWAGASAVTSSIISPPTPNQKEEIRNRMNEFGGGRRRNLARQRQIEQQYDVDIAMALILLDEDE